MERILAHTVLHPDQRRRDAAASLQTGTADPVQRLLALIRLKDAGVASNAAEDRR